MKKLTIVAPAYKEEQGIRHFYDVVRKELQALSGYESSILVVVDGDIDRTFEILAEFATNDEHLTVLKLSRNFGHQHALLAGLDAAYDAGAEVIISMDADLQHPPSVIPQLLEAFERGNEVVRTKRNTSSDVSFVRRAEAHIFYRFLNSISDTPIIPNASDFRLISRRVAGILRTDIRERALFMRGIINWIGFTQTSVTFDAANRLTGHSSYSLSKRLQFALSGIVSFSKKPLRAAIYVGFLVAVFGFVFAVFTIVQYFAGQVSQPGYATIVVLLTIFAGIQLMFLGVIGEYIGAIFDEVKARPLYLVEERIH